MAAPQGTWPVASSADCDAAEPTRVLAPVAHAGTDARAVWLSATRLRWPGVALADGERLRLHHAAAGILRAEAGRPVRGGDGAIALETPTDALPPAVAARFGFVAPGVDAALPSAQTDRIDALLRGQLLLVREDARGRVVDATYVQHPGALDDRYAAAESAPALGATPRADGTRIALWAPTAQSVALCTYDGPQSPATQALPLTRDDASGTWTTTLPGDRRGAYYTYLVDVFVRGVGVVRNRATDPYAVSLSADSKRTLIADLDDPALKPDGWDATPRPAPLAAQVDMSIYELHVRDFSRDDASVPAPHRGKYLAFTQRDSNGMRHLRALRAAGLTDVHLLPVFDLATIPEIGCATPTVPDAAPDSDAQQAAVMAVAARDCFNWGYDPYHFNAPEGSYASDAMDGAVRIRELRSMVQALHREGLRVGMDVVYNHMTTSGQEPRAVLDRIVPGYYHRLDASGTVERSTCCDNTATEHRMMARLMADSIVLWATAHRIDSFRFDLMGHQPRAAMEAISRRVDAAAGRRIHFIGEGWNFGEVADGKRFVQASQLSLNGSGIGTFSDRARDAVRGGGPADSGDALVSAQGWVNGLHLAPNAPSVRQSAATEQALRHAADLVRVGLAGTLRDYAFTAADGVRKPASQVDYKGQPAGYASQPDEVVNYVENHDNQTLFDLNAYKLPRDTSREDRARVQVLALATTAFSQGVAYWHAGVEVLRSKSLDRNSFDSGDWFNRLDWTYTTNHFGTGLPPASDNRANWDLMRPLLRDALIAPSPREIAFTRDAFHDLLRIRASTPLFRLRTADDVQRRLTFPNSGAAQNPAVVVGQLDGKGLDDARFVQVLYAINVAPSAQTLALPEHAGVRFVLHPVHRARDAADRRARDARWSRRDGRLTVPARTAVVFVVE
ncbi:alpha-1,6-glucosidase domain-containing protein [Cognatilysobacter tabacisoli]|uniref:alpha-1,6-glucosidase domain-containing protein n=1 Tax=Cognatilysobacter tabacisoli TaxID=2315424 RepID=UPI000E6AF139|nr:alpha-1,6-glucosidase domain-containing protein [Lysobacter tabacisoli]